MRIAGIVAAVVAFFDIFEDFHAEPICVSEFVEMAGGGWFRGTRSEGLGWC